MDELVDAATKMGEHGHDVGEEIITYVNLKNPQEIIKRMFSLNLLCVSPIRAS
jgi:hypothetical protein